MMIGNEGNYDVQQGHTADLLPSMDHNLIRAIVD